MSLKYISESSSAAKQQWIIQGFTPASSSCHSPIHCIFTVHLSYLCWWVSISSLSKQFSCVLYMLSFSKLLPMMYDKLAALLTSIPAVWNRWSGQSSVWLSHVALNTYISKPCFPDLVYCMCLPCCPNSVYCMYLQNIMKNIFLMLSHKTMKCDMIW